MLRLSPTQTLQALLGGAVSGTALDVVVCYTDRQPAVAGTFTSNVKLSTVSSSTPVTICDAPANLTIREIDSISVRNNDSATAAVTVRLNDNGTTRNSVVVSLLTLEHLFYSHVSGWVALDVNGRVKTKITVGSLPALSSAELRGLLTDETGTGVAYFQGGDLGTPSAGVLSNCTALPLTTGVTGVLGVTNGGTGRNTSTTAFGLLAAGTTAAGIHQTLPAGATTEILVGGGAAALPVWTTASGSGAPLRQTSPSLTTPTINTAASVGGAWTAAATWTLPAHTLGGTVTSNGQSFSGTLADLGTVTTADINGGTIDGAVIGGSSAAAITGTTVVGNSFVPNSSTVPSNGLYLPAANNLGWATNSAVKMRLDASGNLGIGVTPAGTGKLQVAATTDVNFAVSTNVAGATGSVSLNAVNNAYNANIPMELRATRFRLTGPTRALEIDTSGNAGFGTTTFGTSAVGVISIANGTAPTTGPADTVQFYSSDNAAGHTIPSFFCEGTDVLQTGVADSASSRRVRVRINGTVVQLLAI